jgi:Domain of unknown function (DUF6259)
MASHRNPSGICENALWQLPIEPEKFTVNNGAERIAYAADATVRTRTCTEEQGQEQLRIGIDVQNTPLHSRRGNQQQRQGGVHDPHVFPESSCISWDRSPKKALYYASDKDMNRRTFNRLASFTALAALADVDITAAQAAAVSGEVVLQDDEFLVAFDSASGALTRMQHKPTNWVIQRRPALGVSFRMLVPIPGRRANFVLGQKQRAASVTKLSDNQARIVWNDLASEHGGIIPIRFTATVTVKNGRLSFDATVENNSPHPIETIDFPYFGDLNAPATDSSIAARTMWYGNLSNDELYPNFGNAKGYWGVDFPTKTFGSNRSLFCLIQAPNAGLYFEMSDPTLPYYLEYTFEQHPGVMHGSAVPRVDEFSGFPVHLEFRTCHFAYVQPHSTRSLAPIVVRAYKGDWHAGVDVYREWRNTWFKKPQLPPWAREVHSWTMLRMNSPEEDYTISYSKFIEYGEEYAKYGVKAVQLIGWNIGGQDRDDPSQNTDPHLGTWQEFHDAIAKVQSLGVNVILFGKLNWADLTSDWYKTELYKYEAKDPYGIRYEQGGYDYVTPTQLAGINTRRRAVMDFADARYRAIAEREFQKVLALGSTGWLWDEICHHAGAIYNFAPGHGYNPPGYIYGGDLPLCASLRAAADKISPDFLFAGEGPQDWLMQYFPVSEAGVSATPICQYLDTRHSLMLAGVNGFDDREQLNNILLNRCVIQYEPFLYKGRLHDFPLTMAYGKKIDDLRRRYKSYLWDGDFRDNLGASVSAEGQHHYSVFRAENGKRAVVVVNPSSDTAITANVTLTNPGRLIEATPEDPEGKPSSGTLQIPARSAAVLIEL